MSRIRKLYKRGEMVLREEAEPRDRNSSDESVTGDDGASDLLPRAAHLEMGQVLGKMRTSEVFETPEKKRMKMSVNMLVS